MQPIDLVFCLIQRVGKHIQSHRAFCPLHPFDSRHLFHIGKRPAVAADQPQVKHILFIRIDLSGGDHVGLGDPKSHKNRATQRDNGHNSHISPKGIQNGLI